MYKPKIDKSHKALFAKKVYMKTHNQIDKIVKKTGVSKWAVIDKILSTALGIKTPNPLDLKEYLKGCK